MSTTKYKFAIRICFEYPFPSSDLIDLLDEMEIEYELWGDGELYRIKDDKWDFYHGIETGNTYLDYIISESEFDFGASIPVDKWRDIKDLIPPKYSIYGMRIVAYGYYTGTDEPEIF